MKKSEIEACDRLIDKLLNKKTRKRFEVRNELFELLREPIIRWMKSIMKNKNYMTEQELISHSWDCFLFCLERYKKELKIPIPNHFHSYTKFYLLSTYSKTPAAPEDDLQHNSHDFAIFEGLDELKKFRDILPQEYQIVFDDSLMSMTKNNRDRVRRHKESYLQYYQYREAKKIMKIVIDFLLRR